MSQVGHADSKMTLDVYAQLEQRLQRDHGRSFDRLICEHATLTPRRTSTRQRSSPGSYVRVLFSSTTKGRSHYRERSGWRANLTGETDRIRRLYEKEAPKYDRQMRLFDWALFGGGREWVCSQAQGDALEIAVGNGTQPAPLPTRGERDRGRVQPGDA